MAPVPIPRNLPLPDEEIRRCKNCGEYLDLRDSYCSTRCWRTGARAWALERLTAIEEEIAALRRDLKADE